MSHPLIEAPELASRRHELVICDGRWELNEPGRGRARFLEGHIPGAVFVDLDTDLSAPGNGGRHPLPTTGQFSGVLGRLGIGGRSDVVVYDDVSGGIAARMWWMLRSIGHRGTVRILDGGWQAWTDAGFPVEKGEATPAVAHYPTPPPRWRGTVEADGAATGLLLDARDPERYRGEFEPVDAVPGHIPGAINLPWKSNLVDGRLRDATALRQRLEAIGADRRPTIVSCGSGVTACHLALAFDLAGLPAPRLYPGSYSEWSSGERPVATGPDPG